MSVERQIQKTKLGFSRAPVTDTIIRYFGYGSKRSFQRLENTHDGAERVYGTMVEETAA